MYSLRGVGRETQIVNTGDVMRIAKVASSPSFFEVIAAVYTARPWQM